MIDDMDEKVSVDGWMDGRGKGVVVVCREWNQIIMRIMVLL